MAGRKTNKLLALALATLLFMAGCSGVLYEKPMADGGVQRLRLDGAEGWSEFDTTPRYRSQKSKDIDGYGLMLKSEAIF
jgi:hypothetical protein